MISVLHKESHYLLSGMFHPIKCYNTNTHTHTHTHTQAHSLMKLPLRLRPSPLDKTADSETAVISTALPRTTNAEKQMATIQV